MLNPTDYELNELKALARRADAQGVFVPLSHEQPFIELRDRYFHQVSYNPLTYALSDHERALLGLPRLCG